MAGKFWSCDEAFFNKGLQLFWLHTKRIIFGGSEVYGEVTAYSVKQFFQKLRFLHSVDVCTFGEEI